MATRTRSMNQENGFGFPFTGGKVLGKKIEGPLKPRKPLQELNRKNSENLGPSKALEATKGCVAQGSKPENAKKNGGRRALGDLTNSSKLLQREESTRKNSSLKLPSLAEKGEMAPDPAEEGCLHDHQECKKAQKCTMDKDYFLQSVGFTKDCSTPARTAKLPPPKTTLKLQSPTSTRRRFDHCQTPIIASSALESPKMHLGKDVYALEFGTEWDSLDFSGFKMKESP